MKFCDKCGSYLEKTVEGLSCSRCGHMASSELIEVRRVAKPYTEKRDAYPLILIENKANEAQKINVDCPSCDNKEAYRSVHIIQGEHAGVKQERTVKRFKCSQCSHRWTVS